MEGFIHFASDRTLKCEVIFVKYRRNPCSSAADLACNPLIYFREIQVLLWTFFQDLLHLQRPSNHVLTILMKFVISTRNGTLYESQKIRFPLPLVHTVYGDLHSTVARCHKRMLNKTVSSHPNCSHINSLNITSTSILNFINFNTHKVGTEICNSTWHWLIGWKSKKET